MAASRPGNIAAQGEFHRRRAAGRGGHRGPASDFRRTPAGRCARRSSVVLSVTVWSDLGTTMNTRTGTDTSTGDGPGSRNGPRAIPWTALDAAAACCLTVLLFGTFGPALQDAGAPPWLRLSVAGALALPVALRRRFPLAVLGILLIESALLIAAGAPPTAWPFLSVALAGYLVAATRPGRVAAVALGLALAVLALASLAMLGRGPALGSQRETSPSPASPSAWPWWRPGRPVRRCSGGAPSSEDSGNNRIAGSESNSSRPGWRSPESGYGSPGSCTTWSRTA